MKISLKSPLRSSRLLAGVVVLSSVAVANAVPKFADLGSLTINATGRADIQNNVLIIRSGIEGTPTAGIYNGFAGYAQTGLNITGPQTGFWAGFGLASSVANVEAQGGLLYGIAVVANNQPSLGGYLYGPAGIIAANYAGITTLSSPLAGTEILVRMTYWGDADMNGLVDGTDYSLIDNGFNAGNIYGWLNGDFDYNGVVDGTDYSLIDNAFNGQGAPFFTAPSTKGSGVVPEPGSASLLLLGALGFVSRRNRK